MSASTSSEFSRAMVPIAVEIMGEPNPAESTKDELRWGRRGSFSVDVNKGTWCDHENGGKGGGVLDFLRIRKNLDKPDALDFLRDRRLLPPENIGGKPIVAKYNYTDEKGAILFQVVRLDPKDFRQRRPDSNGGWVWKMDGVRKVLFHLPRVLEAVKRGETIYVCEGEKAVHAMEAHGFTATCSPGGAGKWREPSYGKALNGARVVILADNDSPGIKHAQQVAKAIRSRAWRVQMVFSYTNVGEKGDVQDYFANGGTAADLIQQLDDDRPTGWYDRMPAGWVESGEDGDEETTVDNIHSRPEATDEIKTDNVSLEKEEAQTNRRRLDAPQPAPQEDLRPAADVQAVLRDFNARMMMVNENGKAVILQPGFDPVLRRRTYDRLSVRDLQTLYMNHLVKVGEDEKNRPIFKTAADIWLRHRDRRQFIHGVTFDPTTTRAKPGVLNLWEGFAVTPKPGTWSKMRWHIEHVLCAGVQAHFDYCLKWMGRMVQSPAQQGETAIVLKGVEGCGKGFVARALARITGQHGIAISNAKHLVGNFNAHLRDSIFLFADEAFFAGDKSHIGVLKAIITEPHLTIEGKFQNATTAPNFLHVMMASNEEWVVPASIEARRFFVLNVLPVKVGDHTYFGALHAEMEAGGYEAMLHDLLAMDLTTFNVRSVPTTEGLQQQRKLSLPTTEAWWLDCLERGYVFRSRIGLERDFAKWHPKISMEILFASYIEFAQRAAERRLLSRESLGRFLTDMKSRSARWRSAVVGEAMQDVDNAFGGTSRKAALVYHQDRATGYALGTLDAARQAFTKATGLKVAWDTAAGDDEAE